VRSFTIDVRGPMHVAGFGTGGPTVVLVHGLGGSHLNWLSIAPRLAEDHRVLALDLPGFGLSPPAGRRCTIPANARALTESISRLSAGPVILVGNSMGGLISLGVAAMHPQRVAGLVLVDAALPRPRGQGLKLEAGLRELILSHFAGALAWYVRRLVASGGAESLVRRVLADCCVDVGRLDPAVVDAHIALEVERVKDPRWHESLREAAQSLTLLLAQRDVVEGWVRSLVVPTLLVHGERDRVVSVRAAEAAADLRPDWEFHVLEDTGHVPMLETPDAFLASLRGWLQRQPWYLQETQSTPALAV